MTSVQPTREERFKKVVKWKDVDLDFINLIAGLALGFIIYGFSFIFGWIWAVSTFIILILFFVFASMEREVYWVKIK